MKPADAVVPSGASIPYPSRTTNFHHELELVIAMGKGGHRIPLEQALDHVYGYAVGNDFTRRDLQTVMRNAGRPWEVSKGFDRSAAIGAIRPVSTGGHALKGRMYLQVNGERRQDSDVSQMTWSVPEIIAELSTNFCVAAGRSHLYGDTCRRWGSRSRGSYRSGYRRSRNADNDHYLTTSCRTSRRCGDRPRGTECLP